MIGTPGQMNTQSERGRKLMQIIGNNFFETIVEIGMWNGLGSTLCILKSKKENCEFISLESNLNFFEIAGQNLSSYTGKFKMIHGSIVEHDELLEYSNTLTLNKEQKKWLEEDLTNIVNTKSVLNQLPEKIDLLLLDGGEFASYLEWKKLEPRTKFVALDDTNVLKNNRVMNELSENKNYRLVDSTNEGHGFSIFEKINQ